MTRAKISSDTSTSIVARSASMTFVGIVFQLSVSFISGFIVARVIGPAAFGLFNLTRTLCESATVFTKVGFDIGVVRYLGERKVPTSARSNAAFLKLMLVVVACLALVPVSAVYLGGGVLLQRHVYRYEHFNTVMLAMVLLIPLMSLTQVLGGAFRGYLRIRPRVVAEFFLQPASRLIIIVILFFIGWKLWAVIAGTLLSFVLSTLYLLVLCSAVFFSGTGDTVLTGNRKERPPWADLITVGKYSIVISLTVSVAGLLQRADIIMLGYFAPAEQVGQYAVIQMVVSLIPIFNSSLNQAIAPMLAGFYADGKMEEMRRLIHQHTRWVVIATLPVFLIIGLHGNVFIGIFGKGYIVDVPVITLLALAQFIIAALSSAGFMLSMTGKHMVEFYTMLLALMFNILMNYLLIPRYGILGASIATLLAVAAANALRSVQVYRVHGIFPVGSGMAKPLMLGLGTFCLFAVVSKLLSVKPGLIQVTISSIAFACLYFMLIVRFGIIEEDRVLFQKLVYRIRSLRSGAA